MFNGNVLANPKRMPLQVLLIGLCALLCLGFEMPPDDDVNRDSLQAVMEDESMPTVERNKAEYGLAIDSLRHYPDSLVKIIQGLSEKFKEAQDSIQWALSLTDAGYGYYLGGNYKTAEPFLMRSVNLHLTLKDSLNAGRAMVYLGDIFQQQGRFDESQKMFFQALEIQQSFPNSEIATNAQYGLGNLFYVIKEYDQSIDYYEGAFLNYQESGNDLGASKALSGIANCKRSLEQNEESLEYSRKSLALMLPMGAAHELSYQYYSIGEVMQVLGKMDSSLYYYHKSLDYAYRSEGIPSIIWGHYGLVEHFIETRDVDSARFHLKKVEPFLEQPRGVLVMDQYSDLNLELAEVSGDFKLAYELLKEKQKRIDTLYRQEKAEALQELKIEHETELKDAENATLKSENDLYEQRQASIIIISVVVVLSLLLVATILFFLFRNMRHLNRQLVSANAEKDALMGIVAHDLKAPLNKVGALLGAMEEADLIDPLRKKFTEKMESAIEQGGALIGELESIAELERKDERELTPVVLNQVVQDATESYKVIAGKKGIHLKVVLPKESLSIRTYGNSLDRILGNLISNAIKFSPSNREVSLEVKTNDSHAIVHVLDQGQGIPEEEIPKLFNKFSRLSPRPTAGESSTGLGLYIVKLLVEQIKGSIEVKSMVGKGTQITLQFPLNA